MPQDDFIFSAPKQESEFVFSSAPQEKEEFEFSAQPPKSAVTEKKKNVFQKVGGEIAKGVAYDVRQLGAMGEAGIRTIGGLLGFIPSVATTVGARIVGQPGEKARETGAKVAEFMSGGRTPLIPETQTYQNVLSSPFAAIGKGAEKASEVLSGADVNAQADTLTALEVASLIAPAFIKGKGFKAARKEAIKSAAEEAKKIVEPTKAPPVKEVAKDKGSVLRQEFEAEKSRLSPAANQALADYARKKVEEGIAKTLEREEGIPAEQTLSKLRGEKETPINPLTPGAVRGGSVLPGMPLPERVGPINLDRLGTDYPASKLVADVEDAIHLARTKGQPKETWAETSAKATDIGGAYEIGQALGKSTEEVISDFSKSTKDLAAKVEASRTVLRTSIDKLYNLSQEYVKNPTDENLNKFQLAYADHAAIQYAVGGGSSNIGRALNIHKKTATAKEYLMSGLQKKFLAEMGKDTLDPEAIRLLASFDPKNPAPMMRFLSQEKKATTRQKIFEVWMNSILSNPLTHIINTTSNLATEVLSLTETAGGAVVALAEHPLKPSARSIYFGDAAYQVLGAMHGMKEAIRRIGFAWKAGVPESQISKLEVPTKAIKGTVGEIIRTPSKFLMLEDEAMKGIIYTDSIYSQAYHLATKEGLRGAERKAKIIQLVSEPTERMVAEANHQALYKTFQKELGNFGKSLMRLRQSGPGSEFLFPFIRTPLNIAKYGIERSPLRAITLPHEIRSKAIEGAAREKAIFTTAASVAATAVIANYVMDGKITGAGPTDTNARQSLYRTGWQPYSVKVGNKYYAYSRIEPIATVLGIMADFWEINKSMDKEAKTKVAAQIGTAVKNNIMNKTFLTGLADIMNAMDDPARYGESWVQRLSGSVIPSGVAGVARAIDPNLREAKSIIDTIKSRIPFVSQTLPPKMTPTGEPIARPGTPLSRMFSPIAVSQERGDRVWNELNRLQINMGLPRPTINGKKAEPEDIRAIIKEGGPDMKKALSDFMGSSAYPKMTDEMKTKWLKSIITRYRKLGTARYSLEKK